MGKAIETRMSIRDMVTPAMQRINRSTLTYKRTLRDLKYEGKQTWNELRGMSAFIGIGAVAALGAGVKAGVDFQDQMSQVSTLLDGNVKPRLKELSAQVLQLAKDTGTATSDLTSGLYQTVSAFGDSADSMKILAIANQGAVAGVSTTTDSINLLSAIMKGYGDTSAKMASHVSDLAFETVKLGQTTFPELASSMTTVTGTAKLMGVSLNELFTTEATLTGVIGNAAEVSTDMEMALKALMAPSTQMQKQLDKLGFSTGQAAIKALGFKGTLKALVDSTHGNTAAISKMFGRVEGMKLALHLAGEQSSEYDKKLKEMQHSAGATATAYARATDTVAHKWKVLVQTVNTSLIKGTTTNSATQSMGDILTVLTKTFNFVVKHWTQIGPVILGVASAFAAYKVAALSAAAGEVIFNAVTAANPVGLVALAIGVVIFALVRFRNYLQEAALIGMKTWNTLVSSAQWATNEYIDYINLWLRSFKFVWDSIEYGGISMWNGVVSAAEHSVNDILKLLSPISGLLGRVGIHIPAKVDFSAVKGTVEKPTWDNNFGIHHLDFSGYKFSQDQIMEQTKKAQEERDKRNAEHLKALKDNTNAITGNTDATSQNTDATSENTGSMKKGIPVVMTAEQIADGLMPRLERHLYGTT